MSKGFYFKLAASNIKKNKQVYLPYMLASVFTIMMFYMMHSIANNSGLNEMPGSMIVKSLLNMGGTIIGIFAVIFLFYTNRFLMKRRQKELGLLNILGMNKGHIGKMLFWETLQVMIVCVVIGLLGGMLFDKLMFALLLRLLSFEVPMGFHISVSSVFLTLGVFGVIYLLILVNNLRQIHLTNPAELLRGGQVGEKEPKTKWILAILGVVCMGSGYFIAITTKSPLDAITLFFFAVILVCVGTYTLFTAGSIAVLKLLKNNKRYYYQTKHFVSVSGMIYRMKQNAVGLANICILSTGVLLMLSTTVSLYIGQKNQLENRYPYEVTITNYYSTTDTADRINQIVDEKLSSHHLTKRDGYDVKTGTAVAGLVEGKVETRSNDNTDFTADNIRYLNMIPLSEYNRITGEHKTLEPDEILFFTDRQGSYGEKTFSINDKKYRIKEELMTLFLAKKDSNTVMEGYYLVMPDEASILEIVNSSLMEGEKPDKINTIITFNLEGEDEDIRAFEKELEAAVSGLFSNDETSYARIDCRLLNREEFFSLNGGFFFLGIFLGALFLMATVLIIYYKQISEGYEDKERFHIMQKVGMSKKEVRKSIRSQVLTVFYLPLIMAVLHIAAAFPMMKRLLAIFYLTDTLLFAVCTMVVIVIFAAIYALIYSLTARSYYQIVG